MPGHASQGVPILDIRRDKNGLSLRGLVLEGLNPENGSPQTLPSLLLYDEKGLKLFENITYLDEYYLTNSEIDALTRHAATIAERIPSGTRLIELGSGNLRKVNILLNEFEKQGKNVEYFALDVSLPELHRTFALLDTHAYKHVTFRGLHGTYDDGLAWIQKGDGAGRTALMTLGSSIGNFTPSEAKDFLASFVDVLGAADYVLVGLDACQNATRVYNAYNDTDKVTESFYRNGLDHANRLLGSDVFQQADWRVEGHYDENDHKHHATYISSRDVLQTDEFWIPAGSRIHFEHSYKYSESRSDSLWHSAGLIEQMAFGNKSGDYYLHLLSPAKMDFPDKASDYAKEPVPSLKEWHSLWAVWDTVTRAMVPREELLEKPIKLRNNLIFYLGHIPAFADIHFTKATGQKPTHPAQYQAMFERGIDPDVDNPELCHAHSEIPDTWPPLEEILGYQARVRARVSDSYDTGIAKTDRRLARGLWLAYEHEAMHLETFLYMLIQSDKILPPVGREVPDFKKLATAAIKSRVIDCWHKVPDSNIRIGLHDPENNDGPDRFFGWDNERPSRYVVVPAFESQSRPISNGEYAHFLEATHSTAFPASWTSTQFNCAPHTNGVGSHTNGTTTVSSSFLEDKSIKTVYGGVPLKYALDWPVMASYDELAAYAEWAGGRIPTFEEVRSLYNYVESSKATPEEFPSNLISAVNGHLSNEGVEETPPQQGSLTNGVANGHSLNPKDLFVDLQGCNIGFKDWHPTPITGKTQLCGQGDNGGLWEWTSTPLTAHEGFKPMDLYPGYTADFFDKKHNICLGGSWATVPRVAGRKSFVNWYQRNYPYVWCTARLVRDLA